MNIKLSLAFYALASLIQASSEVRNPHVNCLADVIQSNGLERRELERRASPSWGYEGDHNGPADWGKLAGYTTCATGGLQTPINLGDSYLVPNSMGHPVAQWPKTAYAVPVIHNGHTIQLNFQAGGTNGTTNQINGVQYTLIQQHFHSPSEHHVDEKYYPLEAHFVHKANDGSLNVIGVFFDVDENDVPDTYLASILANPPTKSTDGTTTTTTLKMISLQAIAKHIESSDFYRYKGSLTTPPCSEGVYWMVAKNVMTMSTAQFKIMSSLMPFNARPTQKNTYTHAPLVPGNIARR